MSLLVGTVLDQIQQELNLVQQQIDQSDIFMYLANAVAYFSTSYAFPTAKRSFDVLLFNGVREYSLPSDFGTLIEPRRPSALRSPSFPNQTERELYHWPYGRHTAVDYDGATPYLNALEDSASSFLIQGCEDTTGVTISGDGATPTLDNMIYTEGLGSLRFVVTAASGSTTLTFALSSSFDITDFLTKNWCFIDLGCPSTNTANITSVTFRIGDDASNYYQMTATTRYRGQAIGTGFGLIGFDLTARTTVGVPSNTSTDFLQVVINHGLTGVNGAYHIDNIFTAQGLFYQIPYYSINNILTAAGVRTNVITATTDTILMPLGTDESVKYKALELIASSPNVANQSFANYAARELKPKEDFLAATFPHQRSLVQSTWYKKLDFKKRVSARRF